MAVFGDLEGKNENIKAEVLLRSTWKDDETHEIVIIVWFSLAVVCLNYSVVSLVSVSCESHNRFTDGFSKGRSKVKYNLFFKRQKLADFFCFLLNWLFIIYMYWSTHFYSHSCWIVLLIGFEHSVAPKHSKESLLFGSSLTFLIFSSL